MKPEMSERFFKGAEGLGDFVGVVDGDVVDAAGVNVDRFAEEGVNNCGTFEVPTWVAWATEEIPAHGVGFAGFDELPDGKVGGVFFGGGKLDTGTGLEVFKVEASKIWVCRETRSVKIETVFGFVSVAVSDKGLDESL